MSSQAAEMIQTELFEDHPVYHGLRQYGFALTVSVNRKGVVDVDTVKGCTLGMRAYPEAGCYDECYANAIARRCGIDFTTSVKRILIDLWYRDVVIKQLLDQPQTWYRIGVMGDPCHAWSHTLAVCRALRPAKKAAVIITKHWISLSEDHISQLLELDVVVHTSTSGMDTDEEIEHRVNQLQRLRAYGVPSINRVVTCRYGDSLWGRDAEYKQRYLLSLIPVIDNPLRAHPTNHRVVSGDIVVTRRNDSVGGGTLVSLHDDSVYLGRCNACPDQCGVAVRQQSKRSEEMTQQQLFQVIEDDDADANAGIEFRHVERVIGSGFEQDIAKLALEDGIAHRAARKNMQIHSAIVLLMNGHFAGFFTFQNNHDVGEFCMLQSVIKPEHYTPKLYRDMAQAVLACNVKNYPALITTNPKSTFETPAVFESLGFETYLKMSGFHYMLKGDPAYHRMKVLAHITMTNVWNSVGGEWLKLKKEWNAHIDAAGQKHGVENPAFATREGCWQGESGFANVVTGRSHNANASVLDPVACEVILRFFTPRPGGRVYNPFGGGVQFGYVAGASGYAYLATEIRQNQCDANNKLCSEFNDVRWIQADSSTYEPDGMFDLVFSCPPYYRVEKYVDYDGRAPDGEINSLPTYETFRDALFAGYKLAIDHLNNNRFIVVMTGDSRTSRGDYHCHEAETEVWLKEQGLSVYNKIVYLEAEFTRLAQAKKTLHYRKFPKREQRIIVAYKGDMNAIATEFASIGRL